MTKLRNLFLGSAVALLFSGCAASDPVSQEFVDSCAVGTHTMGDIYTGMPEGDIPCFFQHPVRDSLMQHFIKQSQMSAQGLENYYSGFGVYDLAGGGHLDYIITIGGVVVSWGDDGIRPDYNSY